MMQIPEFTSTCRRLGQAILIMLPVMLTAPGLSADQEVEKTVFLVIEEDRVIGTNAQSGQFADLDFSAKEKMLEHFVANGAAVVITNQRYAGYGAFTGGWRSTRRIAGDLLRISKPKTPRFLVDTRTANPYSSHLTDRHPAQPVPITAKHHYKVR